LKRKIVLVPVFQVDDGKLIGIVARHEILGQKSNEGFRYIGERRWIAKTSKY
jgi:hypothetical protein